VVDVLVDVLVDVVDIVLVVELVAVVVVMLAHASKFGGQEKPSSSKSRQILFPRLMQGPWPNRHVPGEHSNDGSTTRGVTVVTVVVTRQSTNPSGQADLPSPSEGE
jgi:hypothetical protein